MARGVHGTVGVGDLRFLARGIVVDDLKLEAAGGFVITDDFDSIGALLKAEIKPVLKQKARHDQGHRLIHQPRRRRHAGI